MNLFCDLHTHSYYSDGTSSPAEIVELAKQNSISAVALCDHNTIGGVKEFLNLANKNGIIGVSGCEISTEYQAIELHILALFIPENAYGKVTEFVAPMLKRKLDSNKNLIDNLNANGYKVSFEKLVASSREGNFNRANIAAELVKNGYVDSIASAFKTVLSKIDGFYNPPKRIDSFEAIRFIKSIGAVPVLAHPFIDLNETELREFLKVAVPCGLLGMETIYSTYSQEESDLAKQIATEYGILQSGGSDFHGENKPSISLGTGKGNLQIPYEFYLNLKSKQQN